jgi:mannose-6-phosphate isomerase-like protein (cupin superfamily)
MKLFPKQAKPQRGGGHWYFGDFGEIPVSISLVDVASPEQLEPEARHLSRSGYKFFVVLRGSLEIEVGELILTVGPEQTLMIEPGEIHRILKVVETPCQFLVFGTVKDPSGADKVVVV